MSRRKLAKAKAKRASKARAAQAAKHQALEAKVLLTVEKPKSRVRRIFSFKGLREGLLTFGAIAGVVCMLLAVASFTFDLRPVIFRSGSMSPAIDTGALAISHTVKAQDLAVGDIVTVKTSTGVRVTHRIQSVTFAKGHASLILKGDANKVVDDHAYRVKSADRVLFDIPKAGYVVNWLSGPVGIFAGGLLAGLLVLTAFGPGTRNQSKPGARRLFGISVATLTLGLISTGIGGSTNTQAYYTDAANVQSGTFTAGNYAGVPPVPPAPVITSCTVQNGMSPNNFVWTWANTTPATLPANTQFKITYSNFVGSQSLPSPATQNLTDNTSPYSDVTVPVNDVAGDFVLTVTTPGGTSVSSNKYHFSGKNNSKLCAPAP